MKYVVMKLPSGDGFLIKESMSFGGHIFTEVQARAIVLLLNGMEESTKPYQSEVQDLLDRIQKWSKDVQKKTGKRSRRRAVDRGGP